MRELLAELTRALDQQRPCVWCSVIETRGSTPQKAGAAMLVFPDGSQAGTLGDPLPDEVRRHLIPVPKRPRPAVHRGIAYLPILPRITLFIVGGGHVGQAVARLAAEVDFDLWVLDDRERYASRERFPAAGRL